MGEGAKVSVIRVKNGGRGKVSVIWVMYGGGGIK